MIRKDVLKKIVATCSILLILSGCTSGENGSLDSPSVNNQSNVVMEKNSDNAKEEFKVADIGLLDEYSELVTESTSEEAQNFSTKLNVGWNLGNTLDTYDDNIEVQGSGLSLETKWCGVYTTKELIDTVKALGFDTIRIPVSWHNHLNGSNYIIGERWLDRVEQIVDYAIDNDMYVILNIHHDVDKKYYYPDASHLENSTFYLQCIWTQLATRFKDYDDRLIFESINEPRLVGHKNEWWLENDNRDCVESMETINTLNQVFVDTVRASGGNNINRYLLIPGYDTSPEGVLNDTFKLPEDIASHKLIVTVHAYKPYDLALAEGPIASFTDEDKEELNSIMENLYDKFVSKGIPVLIGEFGILDKNNISDREAFTDYYVRVAKEHGMACLWWDNNSFDSNASFGLIDRRTLTVVFPGIVEAMTKKMND